MVRGCETTLDIAPRSTQRGIRSGSCATGGRRRPIKPFPLWPDATEFAMQSRNVKCQLQMLLGAKVNYLRHEGPPISGRRIDAGMWISMKDTDIQQLLARLRELHKKCYPDEP